MGISATTLWTPLKYNLEMWLPILVTHSTLCKETTIGFACAMGHGVAPNLFALVSVEPNYKAIILGHVIFMKCKGLSTS